MIKDKVREFFLTHPHSSLEQVATHLGCTKRTASRVRAELIKEGKLEISPYDRRHFNKWTQADIDAYMEKRKKHTNANIPGLSKENKEMREAIVNEVKPLDILTAKALMKNKAYKEKKEELEQFETSGDILDNLVEKEAGEDVEDISPEQMKRIITRFIKHPALPPNIRMMAITKKLELDYETQDRHKLGPGAPLSREDALNRMALLIKAVGLDFLEEAIKIAVGGMDVDNSKVGTTSTPDAAEEKDETDVHTA